jgi:hypothetical protein
MIQNRVNYHIIRYYIKNLKSIVRKFYINIFPTEKMQNDLKLIITLIITLKFFKVCSPTKKEKLFNQYF